MNKITRIKLLAVLILAAAFAVTMLAGPPADAQSRPQQPKPWDQEKSSFTPVVEEPFDVVRARDKAAKPRVMAAHQKLLEDRYDLRRRVDESVRMTRGKPIPVGPTARLKTGVTWEQLGRMTPDEIRDKGLFPYLPLPHVNQPWAGWFSRRCTSRCSPGWNASTWISICRSIFCRSSRPLFS